MVSPEQISTLGGSSEPARPVLELSVEAISEIETLPGLPPLSVERAQESCEVATLPAEAHCEIDGIPFSNEHREYRKMIQTRLADLARCVFPPE